MVKPDRGFVVNTAAAPPFAQEETTVSKTRTDTATTNQQWTKQNLAIALPALMGLLADPVLSMVDTGFVGRSGPINLAALGVCTSIFHMTFTIFRASTVATTSLVGSAETEEEKRQITKLSLQFAGVLGTLVLVGLRLGGPHALATMGVSRSSELFKPACDYLFARCWAAPAVVGRKWFVKRKKKGILFETLFQSCAIKMYLNLSHCFVPLSFSCRR